MWPNLSRIAGQIRTLPPMNGQRYAALSPQERKTWAAAAYRRLHGTRRGPDKPVTAPPSSQQSKPSPARTKGETAPASQAESRPAVKPPEGLDATVVSLPFLHPATKRAFETLGLATLRDVLWHFPLRMIDYSQHSNVVDLVAGEEATIVWRCRQFRYAAVWRAKRVGARSYQGRYRGVGDYMVQHALYGGAMAGWRSDRG